jgi:hypothetical protein
MTRPRRPPETCTHGVRPEDCHQCSPPPPRPPGEPRGFHGPGPVRAAQGGAGGANGDAAGLRLVNTLTVPARIVYDAAAAQANPFTLEWLAVRAWRASPLTFGLKGYCDLHPDPQATRNLVYGPRGLVAKGLLVRAGELGGRPLYRAVRFGAEAAKEATP